MKVKIITYDTEIKIGHNILGHEVQYSNELNKHIRIFDNVNSINYYCDKNELLLNGEHIELNGSELELYCDDERLV